MMMASEQHMGFRERSAERLAVTNNCDVLIIGGGVNGVGLLRDLALNGVSAILIDQSDFCSGASSASSRMAHGGLRYLEGREFRLVAESARERNRLLELSPHLVKPLEIVVPIHGIFTGLGRAIGRFLRVSTAGGPISFVALKSALVLYEFFGRVGQSIPRHNTFVKRAKFPAGLGANTQAVVSYYDAQITEPEGLIMEMLREAVDANESCAAINHINWQITGSKCEITDPSTGQRFMLQPKMIVNATGAAVDRVNQILDLPTQYVRGIKGAHLVLDHPGMFERMAGRAFYFDDGAGRMIIALPVSTNILIGTTEVETDDPNDHSISEPEIAYLLGAANLLFNDLEIDRSNIIAMTAGIRPLHRGNDNASVTSAARDHSLAHDTLVDGTEVFSMVGGKWTTFRAFAEETSDRCLKTLGKKRLVSTSARMFPGAAPYDLAEIVTLCNGRTDRAKQLIARYGAVARDVATFCAGWSSERPLAGNVAYTTGEIAWLIQERAACTVEDIVMRRTKLYYGSGLTRDTAEDVAQVLIQCDPSSVNGCPAEIDALFLDPRVTGACQQNAVPA